MHPFFYSLGAFGAMLFVGDVYPGWVHNEHCFAYLGCNLGFVGYDGLMHLLSGICVGLGLWWAHERGYVARLSALAFFAWSLGVALVWEAVEWLFDLARIHLLHQLLTKNDLTQANVVDLLGDVVLALLGTVLVWGWYAHKKRRAE